MRIIAPLCLALALLPGVASGDALSLESQLARSPYEYEGRQQLVAAYRESGDHGPACYHAAWLAWLAPRRYADSDLGMGLLRGVEIRDRASRSDTPGLAVILAALQAEEMLHKTCFNGAVAQQAGRLRKDIGDLLRRAQRAEADVPTNDSVARIALAHLALALDDALAFENTAAGRRARPPLLRAAASYAEAAAAWLPEAPGPRRTLAVVRARLAELDDRAPLWELAVAEAERAFALDPGDSRLAELLWTLHLRSGRWDQAREWQRRVNASPGGCNAD